MQTCHSRHPGLGDTANRDLSPSPAPTAPDPLFPGGLRVNRRLTEGPGGRRSTHPASPATPGLLLRFISTGSETQALGQSTTQDSAEPVSSLRVAFAAQIAAPHRVTRKPAVFHMYQVKQGLVSFNGTACTMHKGTKPKPVPNSN